MASNNIQQEGMLPVGTILRGTYRVDGYLSSGGFGNTYKVTNVEFDEQYAIKEFFMRGVNQRDAGQTTVTVSNTANRTSFEEQREKFKKEARRLRQLSNSHVVRVHDLFDENGTSYYVMDFIDGESLADRLKRCGRPIAESKVRNYLLQILDGLEEIHNKGFQHLDLKPANIMVDKQGNITIIDFGASKQMRPDGGATASTAICYTPGYAPREQMEQNYEKFGPWTDLYALGATLYNILTTNKPPMPSDIDDESNAAFSFPSTVSDEMCSYIRWLMQPNRTKRPQKVMKPTWKAEEETKVANSETKPSGSSEAQGDETIVGRPVVERQPKPTPDPKPERSKSTITSNDDNNNKFGIKLFWLIILLGAGLGFILVGINNCDGTSSNSGITSNTLDKEYVDLGLPSGTLWATMNIGANSPEEYGDYFAWGETTRKNDYSWSTYKFYNGSDTTLTKYCDDNSYGTVDNKTELEPTDDAAYVNWGSNWRMPSEEQFEELIFSEYTTTEWTTQNGVYGRKITSKTNGNCIFLPAAGYRRGTTLYDDGTTLYDDGWGYYWLRTTLATHDPGCAYGIDIYSDGGNWHLDKRCNGRSVRAVRASRN